MDRVPKKQNPQLLDKVVGRVQDVLAAELPWLRHVFGIAERLVHLIDGKRYFLPNVYAGKNDYCEISPDDTEIGNYCFFEIDEPQYVDYSAGQRNRLTANAALVVWVDMRSVEPTDERNKELVKRDILRVLNGKTFFKEGKFHVKRIYEKAENVFRGYDLDEIDNQFLMHPYCGWRFEGEITIIDECE